MEEENKAPRIMRIERILKNEFPESLKFFHHHPWIR